LNLFINLLSAFLVHEAGHVLALRFLEKKLRMEGKLLLGFVLCGKYFGKKFLKPLPVAAVGIVYMEKLLSSKNRSFVHVMGPIANLIAIIVTIMIAIIIIVLFNTTPFIAITFILTNLIIFLAQLVIPAKENDILNAVLFFFRREL
jgi:hypothetical protein